MAVQFYTGTVEDAAQAERVRVFLRENCIVRMIDTFISILFLREESIFDYDSRLPNITRRFR
jgi:hypothetical protein